MKGRTLLKIAFCACLGLLGVSASAQDGSSRPSEAEETKRKVQFNGLGRAQINNTDIDGELLDGDTTTARRLTDGEFLLDLAINAQPNDKTEIQGILRLRNEFGGFFGAGVSVEIRELWARGVIADKVKYRVGDFDHVMTPYTFFNAEEEGMVNEPDAFRPLKDVIYYEQFYGEGNTRRIQGANLDFALQFPAILDEVTVDGFVARIRGTDFLTVPTRFVGGGRVDATTHSLQDSLGLKAKVGFNLSHVWDDLNLGTANSGIRNMVWSVDFDVSVIDRKRIGLNLVGETGRSSLISKTPDETLVDEEDTFLDLGINFEYKPANLTVGAGFIDVGPDFFSMGAQSKRVDFNRDKSYYNRVGNDRAFRTPTLFDIGRDRALYTFQLSDRLMAYDPRLANVMPYGKATPNRRGATASVAYHNPSNIIDARLEGAFLSEIRGQGTFELKDFTQFKAIADFNINELVDWSKILKLTIGFQSENTTRGGIEVDQVDLSSSLLELGIEAELFKRFDLLAGSKFLSANGSDYVPLIGEFNEVIDFPGRYEVDETETMLAIGARYRFKEDVFLLVQYENFSYASDLVVGGDYTIGQFFVLFSMQF